MPVEFALRPRIRLREAAAPPRRARARLPKFALPALAYWAVIGGLVYEFVRHHDPLSAEGEAALAAPTAEAPTAEAPTALREWWRPLPVRPAQEPPAVAPAITEPAAAEPETQKPIPEPPLAELTAPPGDDAEPRNRELFDPEPSLTSEAPLATNLRAPRRARTRSAARQSPEPAPTRELELTPTLPQNNVGVPAPPLTFAPLEEPVPAHAFAPSPPATAPTTDPSRAAGTSGLPSCESAIAAASQDVDFSGGNRTADLPTQAIAVVLENGAWLASCNVPEHIALDVCVAIKGGHVVGASVTSRPADSALNNCVKRRASSLQFPYSPHLDVARTRF